jgi:hypothetical protein
VRITWLLTATGKHFVYADPRPEMIDIRDIARALSREARFNGHASGFYSVAQHSIMVSNIVPEEYALEALLHDASEAYLKDIPRPLKALLPDYKAIEARVDAVVREKFGLPKQKSRIVKNADLVLLATERRDLMPADEPWPVLSGVIPLAKAIQPWSMCGVVEDLFLARAEELLLAYEPQHCLAATEGKNG